MVLDMSIQNNKTRNKFGGVPKSNKWNLKREKDYSFKDQILDTENWPTEKYNNVT